MLIEDFIITNFDKCNDIFEKIFLSFCTLNFCIRRDKLQNVLWRVCNMTLPTSVGYVIIHCGTNNHGHNNPLKIAEGLINITCMLKKNLHIFLTCLLPRGNEKLVNRSLLYAINSYLKEFCTDEFHYIELDSGWTLNNHLNTELFRKDNFHLNRKDYEKLSKYLSVKLSPFEVHFDVRIQKHQETALK